MSVKQVTGAVLNMIFRLSLSCIIVVIIYRLAMYSYHFGYMVFTDAAREPSPGRDITISVNEEEGVYDIGKTLEKRGLISDAKIFYVQALLLEYKDKLNPGTYTLNTSMKPEEMLEAMSATGEGDGENGADGGKTGAGSGGGVKQPGTEDATQTGTDEAPAGTDEALQPGAEDAQDGMGEDADTTGGEQ